MTDYRYLQTRRDDTTLAGRQAPADQSVVYGE